MTRIERSDAQLDAEAAGRSERSLAQLIRLHRDLYQADLWIERLHDSSGETEDVDPKRVKRKTNGHGLIGATGMPFSYPFQTFLAPEYGQMHPWHRAYAAMRWALCHRTHPEHRGRREWRGSLCAQLVSFTVRHEFSVEATCQVLRTSPDRSGRVLANALRWIEARMDEDRAKQEERRQVDAGRNRWWETPHVHVGLPGLHASECPQCRRMTA